MPPLLDRHRSLLKPLADSPASAESTSTFLPLRANAPNTVRIDAFYPQNVVFPFLGLDEWHSLHSSPVISLPPPVRVYVTGQSWFPRGHGFGASAGDYVWSWSGPEPTCVGHVTPCLRFDPCPQSFREELSSRGE